MTAKQISATELHTKIQNEEPLVLLDVRELSEFKYARIANSVLIPLQEIPHRLAELNPQLPIVVICHHGMRSQQAANYLVRSGFENIFNLTGGIDAWSCQCDRAVPRY